MLFSLKYTAGIVSAPLWDSHRSKFAGLLTATDYINLIQYYCQFPEQIDNVDKFRLSSLRGTISPNPRVCGVKKRTSNPYADPSRHHRH
jgi:hypothetical protein